MCAYVETFLYEYLYIKIAAKIFELHKIPKQTEFKKNINRIL